MFQPHLSRIIIEEEMQIILRDPAGSSKGMLHLHSRGDVYELVRDYWHFYAYYNTA